MAAKKIRVGQQPVYEDPFEKIRKDILEEENKPRALTRAEEQELQDGFALSEMVQTAGWGVLRSWLETLAYHSWVDPRDTESKEKWEWQELNAFHAANTAKEIMDNVGRIVERSQYLHKVKIGEIKNERMKI